MIERRYTNGVPHPPIENVYDFPGSGGVPAVFCMDAKTPLELSNKLLDVTWYRKLSIPAISAGSGLAPGVVRDAVENGRGTFDDVFAICDFLGIKVFGLPNRDQLARGIE